MSSNSWSPPSLQNREHSENDLSLPPISQLLSDVVTADRLDGDMLAPTYNRTYDLRQWRTSPSTHTYGSGHLSNSRMRHAEALPLGSEHRLSQAMFPEDNSQRKLPTPNSQMGSSREAMRTILNPVQIPPTGSYRPDANRSSLATPPNHHVDPHPSGHEYSLYSPYTPGTDQRSSSSATPTTTVPFTRDRKTFDIDSESSNAHQWPEQNQETLSRGKLNYVCEYCGKAFLRPSALKTHVISHTGDQDFACTEDGCSRRFGVRSNMLRHVRLVHRNLRYSSGEQLSQDEWESGDASRRP
ncbi:hypothetical protein F5890DRAFT_193639 [Lentinula detonsa]|uniref:C2H2-type domain-containing protein n=1 Tax=Lentinula detonsa TaxID=2804962 RepID=A0AA38PXH8_9AGAR|nr:hypothetical protein F5890DRAFT_193639 [Lentinula detonsa]